MGFSYVFFSLLLTAYAMWRYFKRRDRGLFYLSLGSTLLTASTILQMVESLIWLHGSQMSITSLRLMELGSLALFAFFVICIVVALKKMTGSINQAEGRT